MLILFIGFVVGYVLNKIKIPGLIGMIVVGLLIGPYCFNAISSGILYISSYLRQVALVIILTRSGLNLDLTSLKRDWSSSHIDVFYPCHIGNNW